MFRLIKLILIIISLLLLNNCIQNDNKKSSKKIIIGTTVGDFGDMVKEKIKPLLEKQGYTIKLIEFSDYIRPNFALNEKNIDINIFQHKPYLEEFKKQNNIYNLIEVFQVPTAPLGLYSGKLSSLKNIHNGVKIAIPNDSSNLSRSLLLIEDLSWIKIKKDNKKLFSIKDITDNPYNIKFMELEAAQLPRIRKDVDYIVINGNYAINASIKISSALFKEKNTNYINWAVIRKNDINKNWVQDIKNAFNSAEFKEYSYKKFQGYSFPLYWEGIK